MTTRLMYCQQRQFCTISMYVCVPRHLTLRRQGVPQSDIVELFPLGMSLASFVVPVKLLLHSVEHCVYCAHKRLDTLMFIKNFDAQKQNRMSGKTCALFALCSN